MIIEVRTLECPISANGQRSRGGATLPYFKASTTDKRRMISHTFAEDKRSVYFWVKEGYVCTR